MEVKFGGTTYIWPGNGQARYSNLTAWLRGEEPSVWKEYLADITGSEPSPDDVYNIRLDDWLEANYPYLLEAYNITHLSE